MLKPSDGHLDSRDTYGGTKSPGYLPDDGLPSNAFHAFAHPPLSNSWSDIRRRDVAMERPRLRSLLSARVSRTKITLVLMWVLLLWWGEKRVFSKSVSSCAWDSWERWPAHASPHRVVLLADPQLVDPHTYPGRPWPFYSLTLGHTDQYMRRAFVRIQKSLSPHTVFFLGDLFDGGREWSTPSSESPEPRWRKYGMDFWLQEYARFGRIYVENWNVGGKDYRTGDDRKLIASLPGNHDLGIGNGIQLPVRDRFNAFFGDGNRVDIIGNHTFVSVDTVSLSANGQPVVGDAAKNNEEIWKAPEAFLAGIANRKSRAWDRELRLRFGKPEHDRQDHSVVELSDPAVQLTGTASPANGSTDAPTILLTHVPLYRPQGTPCGPWREKYPPSRNPNGSNEPLEHDPGNAIRVDGGYGYQYQNVLRPDISRDLIERIGNVEHVFSGDDHDYCEVTHRGFTSRGGGVRETTVKSTSWAMGVRKPGFLLVSLWNPVDEEGKSAAPGSDNGVGVTGTIQTQPCLLPDQLSIFIRYGLTLALTLGALLARSFMRVYGRNSAQGKSDEPLLPLSSPYPSPHPSPLNSAQGGRHANSGSSSANYSDNVNGLAARQASSRGRSLSPAMGYGIPMTQVSEPAAPDDDFGYTRHTSVHAFADTSAARFKAPRARNRKRPYALFLDLKQSVLEVASIVLLWYAWLAYSS